MPPLETSSPAAAPPVMREPRTPAMSSSMRNPRVLFVGVGEPWKGGAGYLARQCMFLKALQSFAHLHLAMFMDNTEQPAPSSPPFACELAWLPTPAPRRESRVVSLWNDCASFRPMSVRGIDCRAAQRIVGNIQPDGFDAVFAYRIDFAYFAGVLNHPRLILDIDDPEHLRRRQRMALPGERGGWFAHIDLRRLRRFERRAAAGARAAFVCQEIDRLAFDPPRPMVVPNCVDVPEAPARRTPGSRLLFVANLLGDSKAPNVDAARWFAREIWPLVRAEVPGCTWRIVGAINDDLRHELSAIAGVEVAGFVDRLDNEYASAALSIAPIRIGTGTRIKILEAFAHACPVVTTTRGCEGLEVADGSHLAIGDRPSEFAAHCIRLLRDSTERERLGQTGRLLVRQCYDRRQQQASLADLLRELIDRQPATVPRSTPAVKTTATAQGATLPCA